MENIETVQIKKCPRCGEEQPYENYLIFHKTAGYPSIGRICRKCRRENSIKCYRNNRNAHNSSIKRWRDNNIKKYREAYNRRSRRAILNLSDEYIKGLYQSQGINRTTISKYPELIEIKRAQLKVLRLTKNK